jgi:Oxidoreductase molybdopterin binding domain
VATGLACVPLLGAKPWSVYPKLFTWPPVRGALHALERASVAVLVGSALFQLVTGLLNVARWYQPMGFFFTTAHYWSAWLAIGALLVHIAVQLPVIRRELSRHREAPPEPATGGLSRVAYWPPWRPARARSRWRRSARLSGCSTRFRYWHHGVPGSDRSGCRSTPARPPRRSGSWPSIPGTGCCCGARPARGRCPWLSWRPCHSTLSPSRSPAWRAGADATWTGVRIADLLALVGAHAGRARVTSLQTGSAYASSVLDEPHARDPSTLLALQLHGEPLALDHGYPARLIAPNRPGVLQTKWVAAISVEPG